MRALTRNQGHRALLAGLLLLYLAISLRNLAIVPQVYEDEPWQAATGWKFATEGVFGTDLFAGFYGMERRYYGFMPLHPLLLAGVFRIGGVGLFQARLETVLLGLLTLVLTYYLARRLFADARIGLLAVLLLLSTRLTGLTASQVSGILLLDMARIARYDMVVPVFGLAALHAYLSAREQGRKRWYLAAGILAGLAGLGHLYGCFWLPILILLVLWDTHLFSPSPRVGDKRSAEGGPAGGEGPPSLPPLLLLCLGFALVWAPYLVYVLGDLESWRGQTQGYADRFDLLNPRWYLDNLRTEYRRYGPGLGPVGPAMLLRAGFWSALVALPLSLGALGWRGLRHGDRSARAVVVPALVFPLLFALLIRLKLVNYTVAFAPLGAIAAAWGGVTCWAWLGRTGQRWARPALALLLAAVLAEGAARVAALERAASTTTPYYSYIAQVRRFIPPGARVLGLHNYWFGLEDFDYRSFAVPLAAASPGHEQSALGFERGLEQVAPDIVLVDQQMREYFAESAGNGEQTPAQFARWLSRHQGTLAGRVEDPTYGLMEIYRVRR